MATLDQLDILGMDFQGFQKCQNDFFPPILSMGLHYTYINHKLLTSVFLHTDDASETEQD